MKNDLSKVISDLEKINIEAKKTFGNLSSKQLNWKPNSKDWSIGQCFEHLIITNNLYFPAIQKVIDGKHQNNFFSKIPFSTNLIAVLMKNSLNPQQKRKMKTFTIFEPAESNISENIIDDFSENNQKLVVAIKAVKDMETHKIKIPEPLHDALNLRLDDAFEILLLHEQRHFLQAERVSQIEGFPNQ